MTTAVCSTILLQTRLPDDVLVAQMGRMQISAVGYQEGEGGKAKPNLGRRWWRFCMVTMVLDSNPNAMVKENTGMNQNNCVQQRPLRRQPKESKK